MRVHPVEYGARQLAVAGDQHAVEILAARDGAARRSTRTMRASGDRQHDRADHEQRERGARVRNDVTLRRPHPQQHAREDDRGHHRADGDRHPLLGFFRASAGRDRGPAPRTPAGNTMVTIGSSVGVGRKVLLALCDRDDLELKAEEPRAEHGQVRRHGVVDEVDGRERPVLFLDHARS